MESKQKKLKTDAHQLKPVVIIGSQGLTESVQAEIQLALQAHELIKIRINAADNKARQTIIETILEKQAATLVNQIGHVAVIYKKNDSN